jgi:serpin B
MKKIFLYAVCIAMITSFSACSNKAVSTYNTTNTTNTTNTANAAVKTPVYPKSTSFNDRENGQKNQLDESFIKSLDNFSYTSASKLLSGSEKNISYSPTSLYMALSIAGIGSSNTTQDEIFSVLGTSGKGIDYLSDQNSKLFRLLYLDNEIGKLKIANSIWLQKNLSFKKSFLDSAVNNFYASLFNVDFRDKNTSKLMSKWVSENTNGILSPQIDIDKQQIMSILNTIYYKDQWTDRFDKDKTKPDTFYLSDGSKVQCDFMNSTDLSHGFIKGNGFTASSLDLKNGGSMIFVLPDKGVSVDSLISTPEKVASLFQNENTIFGKVIFQVPKFSFGNSMELRDVLEGMGIKSAFRSNADFSGITDGTAFISNVKQQTHIAINEEGVEAAAFTQINCSGDALPKNEVAEMILNRPFIFALKSNDRLLFMGVVNNPTEK